MKRICGFGSKVSFLDPVGATSEEWRLPEPSLLDVQAADQTVTVDAGFSVLELQDVLARHGQCLPLPDVATTGRLLAGIPGSIGGLIAMNLPHGLSAQHGGPREWLLEAHVLFHGEPAKSGAKVVKSVAGYDVHKVFVGSRGALGPVVSVTLRTWPLRAVLASSSETYQEWNGEDVWMLRTLPTMFDQTLEQAQGVFAVDRPSCTLWSGMRPERPPEGWMIGPRGEVWRDNATVGLEQSLKRVFDPDEVWR